MLPNVINYFRASGAVARVYAASLFFLTFATYSNSVIAGEELIAFEGLGLLLVFSAAVWLSHLLLWAIWLRHRQSIAHPIRYWSFGPLITAIAIACVVLSPLRWMRFAISAPLLRSVALHEIAKRSPSEDRALPRLIGLHLVRHIDRQDDTHIRFLTTQCCGFDDGGGFVYSADGSEPPQGGGGPDYYTHIIGPWWHWRADF